LGDEPDRAVGGTGDRDLDAEAVALDLDLETSDLVTQCRDVLIEASDFLTRPSALHRRRAARTSALLLSREVLLGDALNDLSPLVHAVQQLGLEIDQSSSKMRELLHGVELLGPVRQEIRLVDDWHEFPPGMLPSINSCKWLAASGLRSAERDE
jgi:hypothetical protein